MNTIDADGNSKNDAIGLSDIDLKFDDGPLNDGVDGSAINFFVLLILADAGSLDPDAGSLDHRAIPNQMTSLKRI